jgi:hypothetical protein
MAEKDGKEDPQSKPRQWVTIQVRVSRQETPCASKRRNGMLTEPAPQEVKPFVNRRNETEIRPERAIRPRRLQEALEGHQRKWICLTLVALLLKKFHFLHQWSTTSVVSLGYLARTAGISLDPPRHTEEHSAYRSSKPGLW